MTRGKHLHVVIFTHICYEFLRPILNEIKKDPDYLITATKSELIHDERIEQDGLKYNTDQSLFNEFLNDKRPKLLLTIVDFNGPEHLLSRSMTKLCNFFLIPTLTIQHGFITGFNYRSLYNAREIIVWGWKQKELELKYNHSLSSRVKVIGCPRHDAIYRLKSTINKQQAKARQGLQNESYGVFISQTHFYLNTIGGGFLLREVTNFLTGIFRAWKFFFPDKLVVIRLHPDEARSKKINAQDLYSKVLKESGLRYKVDSSLNSATLYELLYGADFVVGFDSSVNFEALLFGKQVLCLTTRFVDRSLEFQDDFFKESKLYRKKLFNLGNPKLEQEVEDSFRDFAKASQNNFNLETGVIKKYANYFDGQAAHRVKEEIDRIILESQTTHPLWRFLVIKYDDWRDFVRRIAPSWLNWKWANLKRKTVSFIRNLCCLKS